MTFRPWPAGWRGRSTCLLLLVAVAAVAAAIRSRREPATVSEFLERLRAAGIEWQVAPVMQGGGPEGGAYLCDRPRRREELQYLGRWPDLAPRWRGVVLADQHNPASFQGGWEESGVVVGGVSLYGDPEMLQRILAALRR